MHTCALKRCFQPLVSDGTLLESFSPCCCIYRLMHILATVNRICMYRYVKIPHSRLKWITMQLSWQVIMHFELFTPQSSLDYYIKPFTFAKKHQIHSKFNTKSMKIPVHFCYIRWRRGLWELVVAGSCIAPWSESWQLKPCRLEAPGS